MKRIIPIDYKKDRIFEAVGESESESTKQLDKITEKYFAKTLEEGVVNKFDIMKEINESFSDEQVLVMATMLVSDKIVELLKKESERTGDFIVGSTENIESLRKFQELRKSPLFGPLIEGMPDGMREMFIKLIDQKYQERKENSPDATDGSYEAYKAHMASKDEAIDREPPLRRTDGDGDDD